MRLGSGKVRDPVCRMMVSPDQYVITYLGMDFSFCSEQCKERFLANPHLYIGVPGEKAPKQKGQEVIKRRRLRLAEPLSASAAQQVAAHLRAMMGVYVVEIDADELAITYDLLQATAGQIESALEQAGARLGEGWGAKLRRAFVHCLEETEVESLEVRPAPHRDASRHHHERSGEPAMTRVAGCLRTGQGIYHDLNGREITCPSSGQNAEFRASVPWPASLFGIQDDIAIDDLTGLCWWRHADIADGVVDRSDAFAVVAALVRATPAGAWCLPSINELKSLVDAATHSPALPAGHGFRGVRNVYWSPATSRYAPDLAWALYLDKGAVGVGQKRQARFHVWAVADMPREQRSGREG